MEHIYDMIIIGGGPGGYTAALYATRAGLDVLLLEKLSAGGQLALTHQIDNYPGFEEGIDGYALAEKMHLGARRFGAKTKLTEVTGVHLNKAIKEVHTREGTFLSKTVVLSTGANPKELGLAREQEYMGSGIHYCAACDGMFYRNKTVVVIGGGNSAAADALLLSRICKQVILIHRRNSLRATKIYHEPLMQASNVSVVWNSTPTELIFGSKLEGLLVTNVHSGEQQVIRCDGIFVSIGRKPNTELVANQLALDNNGYVIADESTRTNLPGVFAVGDVRTKALRQVVTAVADGAIASHYAEEYLAQTH